MEALRLARPDATMLDEINAFRQDMLEAGSEFDGCGPLRRMEAAEWLAFVEKLKDPATVPDNEASRRTILRNGGVYARTVHEPREDIDLEQYWINT